MAFLKHKEYIFSITLFSIITLIVIIHFLFLQTSLLSPWSGGGFAMFSYIKGSDRQIHIHFINDETHCAILPPNKYKELLKIKHFPTKENLEKMIRYLNNMTWVYNPNTTPKTRPYMLPPLPTLQKTTYFQNTFDEYFRFTTSGNNISPNTPDMIPEGYRKILYDRIDLIIFEPVLDFNNKKISTKELIKVSHYND